MVSVDVMQHSNSLRKLYTAFPEQFRLRTLQQMIDGDRIKKKKRKKKKKEKNFFVFFFFSDFQHSLLFCRVFLNEWL